MGEAALPQVRIFYDASLEYGRNTMPDAGLFYIGSAQAQREFAAFCRAMSAPASRPAPPLRSLAGEIDRLEGEILAAYRPPASIDHHRDFILANSALKEARELDAAGLRYGALLRYLQAAQRFAPCGRRRRRSEDRSLTQRLDGIDARLTSGRFDDSVGRIFLEAARRRGARAARAGIPRRPRSSRRTCFPDTSRRSSPPARRRRGPTPRVTVTLVRWPYT